MDISINRPININIDINSNININKIKINIKMTLKLMPNVLSLGQQMRLFSKLGRLASENVILHLVNNKCIPMPLYCLEVCPLNKSDLRSLDFVVTRFHMKLFRGSSIDVP